MTTTSTSSSLPPIFFLIGPPGSAKGTVSSYLSPLFGNIPHVVAGDLLRDEVKNNTQLGKDIIGPILAKGQIVPSEITIGLVTKKVLEAAAAEPKPQAILLDGFPRKIDQSNMFEDGLTKAKGVIYFDCREEVMLKRLLSRGREDDQIEIIKKRFQANQEQCEPVKEMFAKQGRLHVLDTNGSIQEVCAMAKKMFVEVFGLKVVNENVEVPKV